MAVWHTMNSSSNSILCFKNHNVGDSIFNKPSSRRVARKSTANYDDPSLNNLSISKMERQQLKKVDKK